MFFNKVIKICLNYVLEISIQAYLAYNNILGRSTDVDILWRFELMEYMEVDQLILSCPEGNHEVRAQAVDVDQLVLKQSFQW